MRFYSFILVLALATGIVGTARAQDAREIEHKLLKESIGSVKVSVKKLKGEKGAQLALELLDALRQAQKPNESKKNYGERIVKQAIEVLELNEAFK